MLVTASVGLAAVSSQAHSMGRTSTFKFPKDFWWGAATAGHQVEGNNTNSDSWFVEHLERSPYAESSGDACDFYNRFEQDIALLAKLGLNTFRFSLEWSRIEPAKGEFSEVQLNHYRKVAATCREHGVRPMVTFNHFTAPLWFAKLGGWENPDAPVLFERYCARAVRAVGDLAAAAATFNEPNINALLRWIGLPPFVTDGMRQGLEAAAKAANVPVFSSIPLAEPERIEAQMLKAHGLAFAAIKAGAPNLPVGVTLAISDDQAVGDSVQRDRKRAALYTSWLEAAKQHGDFLGVQTYGRTRLDANGIMPVPEGAELTQMGEEFYPQALEQTIRYAYAATGKPIYVTENGVATDDDSRRIAYIDIALAGVRNCLRDGIPVKGYIHWSLLDNFEWTFGYAKHFGLVAVDRATQVRTVKGSALHFARIARRNAIG
ncbi:glycoside hydrolase family 1 protein [Asticcacaulis biprosthecium]|nr:family 1 glycosylhydrolase [Asticcacaulis biprosthecium]